MCSLFSEYQQRQQFLVVLFILPRVPKRLGTWVTLFSKPLFSLRLKSSELRKVNQVFLKTSYSGAKQIK